MGTARRTYEMGFKRHVAEEIESGLLRPAEAARKYDVSPSLIERWRDKYREGTLVDRPTTEEVSLWEYEAMADVVERIPFRFQISLAATTSYHVCPALKNLRTGRQMNSSAERVSGKHEACQKHGDQLTGACPGDGNETLSGGSDEDAHMDVESDFRIVGGIHCEARLVVRYAQRLSMHRG